MSQSEPVGAELSIDDETRERLGLEPGESLQVIHRGSRTLLLQRVGVSSGEPLPWDRDLVLSMDVRAFPLADVLRMLHDAGKSGFLSFTMGELEKSVFLSRGEVVFAASNQSVDRIGESLLRSGAITLSQLQEAENCWQPGVRIGKVMVERGFLSPRELWNGVKHQVEDIVRSLFTHTSGYVHFWEGSVQPDNVVRLSLPTRRLVSEGLAHRDELLRFVASLEDSRVRIVPAEPRQAGKQAGNARILLDSVGEGSTFAAATHRSGLDPLTAARTLQLLSLVGALQVRSDDDGAGEAADGSRDIRTFVTDHVKLFSELISPLVAVDGADAVQERLGRILEESRDRHPELFGDFEVGPAAMLDPEALIGKAQRMVGDREGAVARALGELITYVEFELMNHPHIEDPDLYLEAVEELRGRVEL